MGGPLRILHVVVNMNRGGAETLIMNLYRNIDRSKIQFDFLTCYEGVFDSEIKELGGCIHRIPYISDVGHFKYNKALQSFFQENNHYKIVHSHLDRMSGLVLKHAKSSGIPIRISHSHNTRSEGGNLTRLYKWYAGTKIIPNATNLLACSYEAAKWLFHKKHPSSKLIKNGIDIEKFHFCPKIREQIRNELELDHLTFVLGHVGRFNTQKNHAFLIDIFAAFHQQRKDTVLILVGDGPLQDDIQKKAETLKLEKKIRLLGSRSDINQLLQAFDLFLFPSFHEGLPVSLVEAQGSGLPCLISNHISREVDLGLNLVNYASIESVNEWVEKIKILQKGNVQRIDTNIHGFNEEFNIKNSAYELENFYLSKVR